MVLYNVSIFRPTACYFLNPYDFIRTHDGGLANIGLNFIEQQAYLAKLNPQWQTRPVWAYTMGDTTHSFVPNALVEDSSGHFLMAGYYKKDSTIGGTTYYKQHAMLSKVNQYGELVWGPSFFTIRYFIQSAGHL